MATLILLLGSGAAAASSLLASSNASPVPPPGQDSFYAVPANIAHLPNGTVLAFRRVQAMALADPIPANAWQVKYKTIDQHGNPSAFVTTILVPQMPWHGAGARPLLSYQAAIDALSTKCAPSYVMRAGLGAALTAGPTVLASNAASETANIVQAIQRGFAVAVPDWEGPDAEWISSAGAARGVLDGIRAVRSFAPAGIAPSARIGLIGYSGGALATDWAIQMQPAYAPAFRFVGAALGGTPASLQASIADFAANPGARAAIPLLVGALERSFPQWNLSQYLSATGRTAVANSQNDCLLDSLIRNGGVDPASYERYPGAIFDNPSLNGLLASISPLGYQGVPRTPILFYHSTIDELAPIAKMRQLAARYCAEGVTVHVVTSSAGDHIAYVITGFPTALSYITDRFTGEPAPDDCGTRASAPPGSPRGCPRARGRLRGNRLGPVALGMTRGQVRRKFPSFSTRGRRYMDYLCLSPGGIRVGYSSPKLLRTLSRAERKRIRGRVVLAMTASPVYALRGVRPGRRLAAVARQLGTGKGLHIGLNWWYLVRNGSSRGVLEVRHGIIREIGIADEQLTHSRRMQFHFLASF